MRNASARQPVELLGGLKQPDNVLESLDEAILRKKSGVPAWNFFDRRIKTHNEAIGLPVGKVLPHPLAHQAMNDRIVSSALEKQRMIYIHIPFCSTICTFCAFFRQAVGSFDVSHYVDSLISQINRLGSRHSCPEASISAVYFGGGTPSLLHQDQIEAILNAVRSNFSLSRDCEITLESRLNGITSEYLQGLRRAGVNRISFGVQTLNTEMRRTLGRIAERNHILSVLHESEHAGFESITVDLIYNLPGQTAKTWEEDLNDLASTPVTGASVYSLIPFKHSVLGKNLAEGKEPPLGGIQNEYEFYSTSDRFFTNLDGWKRFSPVHYGKVGYERNLYNTMRSAPIDILGFGAGGGGRVQGLLYMNPVNVSRFIEDQQNQGDHHLFAVDMDPLFPEAMNCFSLTDSLSLTDTSIPDFLPSVSKTLSKFQEMGAVRYQDGQYELSGPGFFWGYNISAAIAQAIRQDMNTNSFQEVNYE